MEKKGYEEKRRYVRFGVQTKVNFQVQQRHQAKTPLERVSAITKNLSVKGACFISDTRLQPGDMLKLEITLPSQSEPLHLEAQVIWSDPIRLPDGKEMYETGVKLFTLEKSDESRFIEYTCDKMMQRLSQYLHL